MEDEVFDSICSNYWPIHFTTGSTLNIVVYWLILTKTTKVFQIMKYFLIPSNTSIMFLTIIAFFFQGRLVYNNQSMAVMGLGMCQMISPIACVYSYNLILVVLSFVILINLHTLYYRMVSINGHDRSGIVRRVSVFSSHYLFSIGSLILSHIRTGDLSRSSMQKVYNETLIEHPNYCFNDYKEFGGFQNIHSVWNRIMTYSYLSIACYAPIFGLFCRYKTLHVLDLRINALSEKTITQFKTIVHGLTIQVALPLLCYVPAAILNTYNQTNHQQQMVFAQYTLMILITIPALIDPILCIYFIIPYRKAIQKVFHFQIVSDSPASSVYQSSAVHTKPITII